MHCRLWELSRLLIIVIRSLAAAFVTLSQFLHKLSERDISRCCEVTYRRLVFVCASIFVTGAAALVKIKTTVCAVNRNGTRFKHSMRLYDFLLLASRAHSRCCRVCIQNNARRVHALFTLFASRILISASFSQRSVKIEQTE